jgi:hypothetical protein
LLVRDDDNLSLGNEALDMRSTEHFGITHTERLLHEVVEEICIESVSHNEIEELFGKRLQF